MGNLKKRLINQLNQMKKLLFTLALAIFITITANSQTNFDVPENIQLKAESDYARYESDVINAAKWLEETDLDKEVSKRKNVGAFIIQWISGAPNVTVDMTEALMNLYGENHQLMAVYLANYSRHFLENKDATKASGIKAGIISMINVYKKGIAITKNKEMDKAIKSYGQNKIDEYIAKKF